MLKTVHKVIQFNQEAWMKLYIYMNTEYRKKAKNKFEKNFLKLMINSVFFFCENNGRCKKLQRY